MRLTLKFNKTIICGNSEMLDEIFLQNTLEISLFKSPLKAISNGVRSLKNNKIALLFCNQVCSFGSYKPDAN